MIFFNLKKGASYFTNLHLLNLILTIKFRCHKHTEGIMGFMRYLKHSQKFPSGIGGHLLCS